MISSIHHLSNRHSPGGVTLWLAIIYSVIGFISSISFLTGLATPARKLINAMLVSLMSQYLPAGTFLIHWTVWRAVSPVSPTSNMDSLAVHLGAAPRLPLGVCLCGTASPNFVLENEGELTLLSSAWTVHCHTAI